MKTTQPKKRITAAAVLAIVVTTMTASAQKMATPPEVTTPDKVETRIGALEFKDGIPTEASSAKVYDNLDFTHAFNAYMNNLRGVSIASFHKGFQSIGVKDNEVLLYTGLMDSSSLFLTANADTIYCLGILDLTKGPMVIESPPKVLGAVDDYWFRWVIDIGLPGGDRGEGGGRYLIVPPDYDGPVPDGYFVGRSKTTRVLWFMRAFLENKSDPKPVVEEIKKTLKIYPYQPGAFGTPIAEYLTGKGNLSRITPPGPTVFHEGTGKAFSTLPPTDVSYYEVLNEIVQKEPATSLDVELMGPIAAIGIVKGKPFAPDARMKKILTEAAALGNATSRSLFMDPRDPGWFYYPGSSWWNYLLLVGHDFETPVPLITPEGAKPYPPTGYRTMDARTNFFYGITGITPAMAMRLTGIGSTYIFSMKDANKQFLDGAKTYKVTLPKDIPEENFWSLTLYDNQTRSMLVTPQRFPRAGNQSFPSPAAEAEPDGSTVIYFSPTQPAGIKRGNWIQTDPKKGWFTIMRFYFPRKSFFDKSWRPSEIELVK